MVQSHILLIFGQRMCKDEKLWVGFGTYTQSRMFYVMSLVFVYLRFEWACECECVWKKGLNN